MDWTRLPLARADVDRAAHRRTEDGLLERLAASPSTLVLLVHEGRLAVLEADGRVSLDLRSAPEVTLSRPSPGTASALRLFLGSDAGTDYLALVLPDLPADGVDIEGVPPPAGPADGVRWATLREVGHRLDSRDAGLATAAVGLAAWHERHPRCSRCGSPTEPATAGWTRRCPADGSDHYPRTDPAVIMAITDVDDRLLLGHAAHWPARRFSTLAGYVEPGESLESAVRREVAEEVGVVVGEVSYRGSQPWPFPASLMLAFVGRATTTDLVVDGEEVTEARWFTREELRHAVDAAEVLLPMRTSVARALIEEWFGGALGTD